MGYPSDISILKKTHDDWSPSFKVMNGITSASLYVQVMFISLLDPREPIGWRVLVKGMDDDGLERDFREFSKAWGMFSELMAMPVVSKAALRDMDFKRM